MSEPCRICGSPDTRLWKAGVSGTSLRPEDLRISDSHYGRTLPLFRCPRCTFVFAPASYVRGLVDLYEALSDPGYEQSQEPRIFQMRWVLDRSLESQPRGTTLLDIGAGTGLLVREARDRALDARGVEPSRALVDYAKRLYGVELLQGFFPHPALDGQRFDIVLLVDVIEHVADPVRLLKDCRLALRRGGLVVVVTPDISSAVARFAGKRWWHLRLAHVCLFNKDSLTWAAAEAGLLPLRWLRSKWFFSVGYLAQRAEEYFPLGPLNRLVRRVRALRWLYQRVVPLDLRDSYVAFLRDKDTVPHDRAE